LWEASASVAARIKSSGESGSIQVTTFTYQVLKNKYIFEERGIITVKGKGRMVTYCLQEKK
jgi:class 3 adenylate cyclase